MTLFGILNVHKPSGPTSRDIVNRVERLTRPVRCGHAGTLDPLASGALVICVGPATRLVQYVQRMPKRYQATFQFGCQSPTDDVDSDVIPIEGAPQPSRSAIEAALPAFLGEIMQRPPDHSAVKVAGHRAYALARKGKPVDLAPRPVTIHSLTIRRYAFPELGLDIECGSGTYVRSLGRDLAQSLGTSAVMSALVRTAIGSFRVEDAADPDQLTADTLSEHLQPALSAVTRLPQIILDETAVASLRHGQPIAAPPAIGSQTQLTGEIAAMNAAGQLVAIVTEKKPGELWPVMNLV